jgi:hypothetical protein
MGLHVHPGTMPGGLTPICNTCGVSLCYDISAEEPEQDQAFWDAWVCRDCNGGHQMSLKAFRARTQARPT